MVQQIGVFGGTFDPPHLGHLILAAEAYYQLGLDRLYWVLTPDPPHKRGQPLSKLQDRLELVQAALADAPHFELSRVDMDRPSPHYAVDTVRILRELNRGAEMIYLMGGDSLDDLPNWYHPAEFVKGCAALGVMRRPGDEIDLRAIQSKLPGVSKKVRFIDAPLLEISSTQIRERIEEGAPYRYYLHPQVYSIIQNKKLYRNRVHIS